MICSRQSSRVFPHSTPMKTKSPTILIAVVFRLIALLPNAQAVAPPPDGCYPNFTTAEGCDALSLLSTGAGNTGLGCARSFQIAAAGLIPVLAWSAGSQQRGFQYRSGGRSAFA